MSYAGAVLDMIIKMRQNRELLTNSSHRRIRELRKEFIDSPFHNTTAFNDKKISVEESERIKSEIRKEFRRERIRNFVFSVVILFFVVGTLLILMTNWLF